MARKGSDWTELDIIRFVNSCLKDIDYNRDGVVGIDDLKQIGYITAWRILQRKHDEVISARMLRIIVTNQMRKAVYEQPSFAVEDLSNEIWPVEPQEDMTDIQEQVKQLLSCLSERERQIVTMKHLQGMTYKQIGAEIGITDKHVSVICSKAIAKLRRWGLHLLGNAQIKK